MLVLTLIAVGVVIAMFAFIYLFDALVLRPKNARTAQRILDAEKAAAERPSVILKDTTGWDASQRNNPAP